MASLTRALPGLLPWGLALALAWLLPGHLWHGAQPPPFPWKALLPTALALLALGVAPPLLAYALGPTLARRRILSALEAPPDVVWALLLLALWPALVGPPGWGAWIGVLLMSSVPGEARWLASNLPPEHPFPAAWGTATLLASRRRTLSRVVPRWWSARLPIWLTASLVAERILGLPGLGTDWMTRLALRDHQGLALWLIGFAMLWLLSRPLEKALP